MSIPVLFLIFSRADDTKRVFDEIAKYKPKQLFIAADGPRKDKAGEAELVAETRKVVENITWDCEVKRLYRDENIGCALAASGAIDWFFEHVEEGIILEDDCLPSPDFFAFTAQMLERYRENEEVMMVSGNNFQFGEKFGDASYYFSVIAGTWGWATWKRAWDKYDYFMEDYPQFLLSKKLKKVFPNSQEMEYWRTIFDRMYFIESKNTWDYQWHFTLQHLDGLCIYPNANLVSNIGFAENATHTTNPDSKEANIPWEKLRTIVHPKTVERNREADSAMFRKVLMVSKRKKPNYLRYKKAIKSRAKMMWFKMFPDES